MTRTQGSPRAGRSPVYRLSSTKQWLATCAATLGSTYALDAVATSAGVLLVSTQLLGGLDLTSALLLLAATYIAWGLGVSVNLRANWALLTATGTSTNVLSKALFELARVRGWGLRAERTAAGAGYVGTEIAKETPYYAGAIGAVLLTETITSTEAIVFLGGANLGAAAYEYGLARLTRAAMEWKGPPA